MKKILFLSAIAVLFAACQNKSEYTVQGTITGEEFEGQQVYLEKWADSIMVPVDSAIIIDGKFTIKGKTSSPILSFMTIDGERSNVCTMLMVEPGTVNVTYDSSFHISGSSINSDFTDYNAKQESLNTQIRAISQQYNVATSEGTMNEELDEKLKSDFNEKVDESKSLTFDFIKSNIDNELGQYLFMASSDMFEIEQQKELLALTNEEFKSTKNIKRIINHIETQEAVAIGKNFIDFTMKNPKGEDVSLSDYVGKGKYVFVDFWAAWCGPCISEMPNVVEAYKKYKNKGLEIVGVSLDQDRDEWIQGIEDLNMTWPQMSDLKLWESEAVGLYAIRSIPHTVLLDKEGKIIEKDLRGEQLHEKLAELMD